MANTISIGNLQPISQVVDGDLLPIVDITDDRHSSIGTTKKCTAAQLQLYVQLAINSSCRTSCRAACTAPLNAAYLNGIDGVGATLMNTGVYEPLVIDGVALNIGDRVLVQYQASSYQNGIYTVTIVGDTLTAWVLTRATDFDGSNVVEIQQGVFCGVTLGGMYAETFWFQVAPGPFVVGTSPIVFEISDPQPQFWNIITSAVNPVQMNPQTGYIIAATSRVTLVLPPGIVPTEEVKVQGYSGGWVITQNPGQQIIVGSASSTPSSGSLASQQPSDGVSLLCVSSGILTTAASSPQGWLTIL
jgi:hypothetical protein